MRRIRRWDFAMLRPDPSGGQASALHFSLPARNEHELEEISWPSTTEQHCFFPMT